MSTYNRGTTVEHNGSAWIAMEDATGEPGVDPVWSLLARGVPIPGSNGQVLTVVAGAVTWADASGGLPSTATSGQVLTWDGTTWAAADVPAMNLADAWRGEWVAP